jgi:hypothetical protein
VNFVIVIIVIGGTLLYAKRGAFHAAAAFFITFVACLATINYYTLLEYFIVWLFKPAAPYADGVALLFTFFVIFLFLQYLAVTFLDEHTELNAVVNALAGGVFGAMASLMLAGLLAISWLMLPGSAYYLGQDQKVPSVAFGSDELFLTTIRFIANDRVRGEAPFDPSHSFMKIHTNKYRTTGGVLTETPARPGRGRNAGLSEDANLDRSAGEPAEGN